MTKATKTKIKNTQTRSVARTRKPRQTDAFKKVSSAYGGDLQKKRKGRAYGRPLATRHTMHFVLKSSLARDDWSFLRHKKQIRAIIEAKAVQFGVQLKSLANVGNHLHLHLQLTNRHTYNPFIRAVSAAIMMAVTRASRWRPLEQILNERVSVAHRGSSTYKKSHKFWDHRPWSRIVYGFSAFLTLENYINVNIFEEWGFSRRESQLMAHWGSG